MTGKLSKKGWETVEATTETHNWRLYVSRETSTVSHPFLQSFPVSFPPVVLPWFSLLRTRLSTNKNPRARRGFFLSGLRSDLVALRDALEHLVPVVAGVDHLVRLLLEEREARAVGQL